MTLQKYIDQQQVKSLKGENSGTSERAIVKSGI